MRVPDIEIKIVVGLSDAVGLPDAIGCIFANTVEEARKFTAWCDERPNQQVEMLDAYSHFVQGLWKSRFQTDIVVVPRIGQFYGGACLPEHFLESEFVEVGDCIPVSMCIRRTF